MTKKKPKYGSAEEEGLSWASFYPAPEPLLLCPECMKCFPFSENGASDYAKHWKEEHE